MHKIFMPFAGLLLAACLTAFAHAGTGLTDANVRIGMSVPLSGPEAAQGAALRSGAELYFRHVNASGGVAGRQLSLSVLDDAGEASRALSNVRELIERVDIFALLQMHGIASTEAAVPLLESARVPLIGTTSGASNLRYPVNRFIFNTRASYQREVESLVAQLDFLQIVSISVVLENSAWGREGLAAVQLQMAKIGLRPETIVQVEAGKADVRAAVAQLLKANSRAVIVMSDYHSAAAIIRNLHQQGRTPQFMVTSGTKLNLLRNALGTDDASGLGVSQVVPEPLSGTTALVREYQSMIRKYGQHEVSYAGLEGYISARVLIAGLRKAGRDLSRSRFMEVLESGEIDLGGMTIKYSAKTHEGSTFSDVSVLSSHNQVLF